jgi:Bor protein
MRSTRAAVLYLAVLLAGCYHATIETGRPASNVTHEDRWADSWIYGLVPPAVINTAARCPSGVARVETQLSFLNQLVGLLTLGIYTPMDVRVTCAQGGAAMGPVLPSRETVLASLRSAVEASMERSEAVLVSVR